MANSYFDECEIANCSEKSLRVVASEEFNFSMYWKKTYIGSEVLRGKKLRERNLKSHPVLREYDVVDIDFDRPSCSTNRFLSTYSRSPIRHRKKKRHKSPIKTFNKPRKCPMRIAELAVPTKRHCIETWRNKSETLPSFMVERLRQIIMDEKPVVKIQDAIDCFKIRKPSVKSRSENIRKPNENWDQIRLMSAIFGYKISRKLLPPLNIILNSDLKAISQIVSDEIALVLSTKRRPKLEINNKIQAEVADKVTIWIAKILDDASYKLLLEDFYELEEKEGVVWELIDGLFDDVVFISKPESSSSINKSTSISETISDVPIEIPSTRKNESAIDNIMEIVQSDILQSILMAIVENIVKDDNKVTIYSNSLLDTSNIMKKNELTNINILSDMVSNKQMNKLLTKDQYNDSDTNEVKEDAHLLDLAANENETELQNKRHIITSGESGFDITNINDTITESEKTETKFYSEDINKLVPTLSDNTKENELITDKDDHKQSSNTLMQDIDVGNTVKEFQDSNNIELTQKKEIFLTAELNDTSRQKEYAANYIKVVNDREKITNDDTLTKTEEINQIMTYSFTGEMKENDHTHNKDEMYNTKRFNLQDKIQDDNSIEVANYNKQISSNNILTKAEEVNENKSEISSDQLVENDCTPDESIKKVKFSDINIDVNVGVQLNETSNNSIFSTTANHVKSDTSKTLEVFHVKSSNIYYTPPNDNLLSDVDEPWPNNLPIPKVKVTLSVSKSVLSLGKITEAEEKNLTPPEQKYETSYCINDKESTTSKIENTLQNVTNSLDANGNKITESVESGRKYKDGNMLNDPTDLLGHSIEVFEEKKVITDIMCDINNFSDLKVYYTTGFLEPSDFIERKYTITEKSSFKHTRFLSKMNIAYLPFINISPKVWRKDPIRSEKMMQTDKTTLKNIQIRDYPIVSRGFSVFKSKYNNSKAEYPAVRV